MITLFEYLYRDAGNFKAFGEIGFNGTLSLEEANSLRDCFSGDDLFIAEQLDIPPLYEALYQWSGGPTTSDHCWHEFVRLKEIEDAALSAGSPRGGDVRVFLERLRGIVSWNEELSPHFKMSGRKRVSRS